MKIEDFNIVDTRDREGQSYLEFGTKILKILEKYNVPQNIIKKVIERDVYWDAFENDILDTTIEIIESRAKCKDYNGIVAQIDMLVNC